MLSTNNLRRFAGLLGLFILSSTTVGAADENLQKAIGEIGKALGGLLANQQASQQAIQKGDALVQQGNLQGAKAAYQEALQKNPKMAVAYARLGNVAQLERDPQTAANQYQRAIDLAPKDPAYHDALGMLHFEQKRYAEALQLYQRAVKLAGKSGKAAPYHKNLGTALLRTDQPDVAREEFELALKLDRKCYSAYVWLARMAAEKKDFDEARKIMETPLRMASNDASVHDAFGSIYFEQEKFTESLPHYEQAVRLRPLEAKYHFNLGSALIKAGQRDRALGELKEAVRLNPQFIDAHGLLATSYHQSGQDVQALAAGEQYLRLYPAAPSNDSVRTLTVELRAKFPPPAPVASTSATPAPAVTASSTSSSTAAPAGNGFNGVWDTDFGEMTLTQKGSRVKGTYKTQDGTLDGIAVGNVLRFSWQQRGTQKTGSGTFTLAANGNWFTGQWNHSDDPDGAPEGPCNGKRQQFAASTPASSPPSAPTPATGTSAPATNAPFTTTAPSPPAGPRPRPALYGKPEAVRAAVSTRAVSAVTANPVGAVRDEKIAAGALLMPRSDFWQVADRAENLLLLVAQEVPNFAAAVEWETSRELPSVGERQTWLALRFAGVERLPDMQVAGTTANCFAWAEGEGELRRESLEAQWLCGRTLVRLTVPAPAAVWQQHAEKVFALLQMRPGSVEPESGPTAASSAPLAGASPSAGGAAEGSSLAVVSIVSSGAMASKSYRMQRVPIADGTLAVQHDRFWEITDSGDSYAIFAAANSPELTVLMEWQSTNGMALDALAKQRCERLRAQYAYFEPLPNRTVAGSPAIQNAWLTSFEGVPQEALHVQWIDRELLLGVTVTAPPAVWKKHGSSVLRLLEDVTKGG